jgi:hypothetical protein
MSYVQYVRAEPNGAINRVIRQLDRRPAPRGMVKIQPTDHNASLQQSPENYFLVGDQVFPRATYTLVAKPWDPPAGVPAATTVVALNDRGEEVDGIDLIVGDGHRGSTPVLLGWHNPADVPVKLDPTEVQRRAKPITIAFLPQETT